MTSGAQSLGLGHRLLAVARLADHLESVLELEERPQPLTHDRVIVGDQHADHRGSSRRTVVPAPGRERISRSSAELPRALLHRGQAEVTGAQLRAPGIKARAVVADVEYERVLLGAQAHGDALGAGVAHGVVQRFVGDAQDVELGVGIQSRLAVQAPSLLSSIGTPWTRSSISACLRRVAGQPIAGQFGRAQPEDEAAQLLQRLPRQGCAGARAGSARPPGRGRTAWPPPRR